MVAKADQERKAAIIRAEGEAEAAELISKAMSTAGTGMIEVRLPSIFIVVNLKAT